MWMRNRCSVLVTIVNVLVGLSAAGKRGRASDCADVKESFLIDKPTVAATVLVNPVHDGSLELCRFSNHSEFKRPSCCSHSTENELLQTAQAEYTSILRRETSGVIEQLGSEDNLKNHYERMLAISKRMTEYELGSSLNLHHLAGRKAINDFYSVLENILLSYNRSTSVFKAIDALLDDIFVYVVREATTPGSRDEPLPEYASCVKKNRQALDPPPFSQKSENQATSLHYSAIAGSYLSEAMDVTFQALNFTRDFQPLDPCLRDLIKLNHCQKCYGYTDMRPCREFCEDVFVVCLNTVVRLDSNWEYNSKIVKILAEYILTRVNLQSLLNRFHTEFKSNIDVAIIEYSTYKVQLEQFCGKPVMVATNAKTRLKVWEKPSTTSYEGDFSGDLRKLVVNLELKVQGFYSSLHSSICASEPVTGQNCWDGLTESFEIVEVVDEENKKKIILEFEDRFSHFPEKDARVTAMIDDIKRIRNEVLKIFLKTNDNKQNSDDELEGSGSGDEQPIDDDGSDDEDAGKSTSVGASQTIAPLRANVEVKPGYNKNTVTGSVRPATWRSSNGEAMGADDTIEIVEETTDPEAESGVTGKSNAGRSAVKGTESSAHLLSLSAAFLWTNVLLVLFHTQH